VGSVWVPFRLRIETGECGVNSSVKKILSPTLIVPPSPDLKFVKISCGNSQNLALVVGSEGGLKVVSWGGLRSTGKTWSGRDWEQVETRGD